MFIMSNSARLIITNRAVESVMMLSVGLWGIFGGTQNLFAYQEGMAEVQRAIMASYIGEFKAQYFFNWIVSGCAHAGYAFIYVSKLMAGILCSSSAYKMWKVLRGRKYDYVRARNLGVIGCGVGAFMLFFGFFVIGGVVLGGWKSQAFTSGPHHYAAWYFSALMLFGIFFQRTPAETDLDN